MPDVLKTGFQERFQQHSPPASLEDANLHIPQYATYIWQSYRNESCLQYGLHSINSARGVHQGDPLGSLLFCLAIKALVISLKSNLNLWYLDNGCLGGCTSMILGDLQLIMDFYEQYGLQLN